MGAGARVRRSLLSSSAVAVLGCSLALDFSAAPGAPPDGADVDAALGSSDGPSVPPDAEPTPDAIALDSSPYCRTGSTDVLDPATGTCYLFLEFGQSYPTAELNCQARGGARLVSITSASEFELVRARMRAAPYWIGLTDAATEGTFAWASGEPVTFTNWRTGEPNEINGGEDCTVMYGNYVGEFASYAGFWNDSICPDELWAVCELVVPIGD